MPNPSTRELFEILFPGPMPPGQLAIYTTTLKSGTRRSHWCHELPQADRLCRSFRSTRRVRVGAGLQSRETALAVAHERRPRAHAGNIRGCDAAITALTTLWAVMRYGGRNLPPDLQAALGLVDAVDRRPAIVISAVTGRGSGPRTAEGGVAYAFWRLDRPWAFAPEDDSERAAARALLARLQGAVARRAAELGWRLGAAGDPAGLAATFPLPGFSVGARAGGPRAVLEAFPLLPGDGLCRRRDFECLPEPPAADRDPWHDVLHSAVPERRLHDFSPIAAGCSWISACRAERAGLSPRQLEKAVKLLARCQAPGADNRRLVHLVCGGHPGSDPLDADRMLARALRDPGGAVTCDEIGEEPGVIERHCSKCPHFGRIQSPVELATNGAAATAGEAPAATLSGRRPEAPTPLTTSTDPPAARRPIVSTPLGPSSDQAEILEALEPVLAALGGAATARRITRALAADPGRFPAFAGAFERLAPGLAPGDPKAAAALGYRLRALKDQPLGGRVLVESDRTDNTVVWAVERPAPATPERPSPPSNDLEEESHAMQRNDRHDTYGPSPAALDQLERLERHREALRHVKETPHQSVVRSRLERHFDFMEEIVCEDAFDPAVLDEAWQEVEQLEALYWQENTTAAPKPAANDTLPTSKAA